MTPLDPATRRNLRSPHAMGTTGTGRSLLVNPHARPTGTTPLDADEVRAFHRSLPGYRPTPLVDAPALAARLGVGSVQVKDESGRLGMPSFKILGASWATFRVLCGQVGAEPATVGGLAGLRTRLGGRPLTLVAATDGNHGHAVARMARLLGLGAHILVPRNMATARVAAIREENARVTHVDGTYDDAVARSAELADDRNLVISDTSWAGYEQVPAWVIDGYATIADEIQPQVGPGMPAPTVVVAQIGVGAFAAAMVRSFLRAGVRVIGVEPATAACVTESIRAGQPVHLSGALDSIMAGLNCGTPSRVAWPVLRAGVDTFLTIDDGDAVAAMRALADVGVVSGESGAAGLGGLLAFGPDLGLGPQDHVLVVSTEGATDPAAYRRIVRADRPGQHSPEESR
jgi:diaminopropionate ammonia-lyase